VSRHIFVDETKRAGYVIAAVTVPDTEAIRRVVRALVLPGQRRIHMKHEQARRRRIIVSALAATQVQATVYDAARRYRTDLAARTACLTVLVEDIAALSGDTRLVIEQDDSLVSSRPARPVPARTPDRHRRPVRVPPPARLRRAAACPAGRRGLGLGPLRRVAAADQSDPDHRPHRLTDPAQREARAPRPSGRVSGSLPRSYCRRHH